MVIEGESPSDFANVAVLPNIIAALIPAPLRFDASSCSDSGLLLVVVVKSPGLWNRRAVHPYTTASFFSFASFFVLPEIRSMHPVLNRNLMFVKEHPGIFKASSNYDIFDPQTNQCLMYCREENLGAITKLLRFTDYKRMTPFDVQIRTPDGQSVVRIKRGICLFLSKVDVFDEANVRIGGFKQKFFSLGGAFSVLGANDEPLCELKGKWTSWDFRFMAGDNELARVSKKWAGLGKELFTSADNYMLEISNQVPFDHPVRQLILAAVMCIDMVLKE